MFKLRHFSPQEEAKATTKHQTKTNRKFEQTDRENKKRNETPNKKISRSKRYIRTEYNMCARIQMTTPPNGRGRPNQGIKHPLLIRRFQKWATSSFDCMSCHIPLFATQIIQFFGNYIKIYPTRPFRYKKYINFPDCTRIGLLGRNQLVS